MYKFYFIFDNFGSILFAFVLFNTNHFFKILPKMSKEYVSFIKFFFYCILPKPFQTIFSLISD